MSTPEPFVHLHVEQSPRGLNWMPSIPSENSGSVGAYASSDASGPHVWLFSECLEDSNKPGGPTVDTLLHLTAENAWRLAEQLMTLVRDHYQGDARPDARAGDLEEQS